MPTPRYHGGAGLQPINLVAPAFQGLNLEREGSILGAEWATLLNNAVLDDSGRISVRNGFTNATSTFDSKAVETLHEYRKSDGTTDLLAVMSDGAAYRALLGTPASIASAATFDDTNCDAVNFKDSVFWLDEGTLRQWDGSTFSAVTTSGTLADGSIMLAAFGRLWGVDANRRVIRYTDLLDETAWNGVIDMTSVWPDGQDTIQGIAELGGDLVVFGKRQIVVWTDGVGATLGIDPNSIYVSDTIVGYGLIGKRAIARVDGDLWFLSQRGVISMGRLLQSRSSQVSYISGNVEGQIINQIGVSANRDRIGLTYSANNHICVLVFPETFLQVCFDTRHNVPSPDGGAAKFASTWTANLDHLYATDDGDLYGTLSDAGAVIADKVFRYSGFQDNETSYTFSYQSGWLDLGQAADYEKMLKKIVGTIFIQSNTFVNYNWGYDFEQSQFSEAVDVTGSSNPSEWGIAEWGENEWGGGAVLREITVNTRGRGQYIRVGLGIDTAGAQFALQQLKLLAKIGRLSS